MSFIVCIRWTPPPLKYGTVKIRLWRSGHHWPQNREEMIRLGFALELNLQEMNHVLKYVFNEPELYPLNLQELVYISMFSCGHAFTFAEAAQAAAHYQALYAFHREQFRLLSPASKILDAPLSDQLELLHQHNQMLTAALFRDFPEPELLADNFSDRVEHLLITKPLQDGWLPFLPPVPDQENWRQTAAQWMQVHWKVFDYAYMDRQRILISLAKGYLANMPAWQLEELNIAPGEQFRYLRHIVYTDAMSCIWQENIPAWDLYDNHGYSQNFSSELQRYFKPGTPLARDTVIRLLLLFTMPDIDAATLNHLLETLGYAPLTGSLARRCGARTDLFLLLLLELFETRRTGNREKDAKEMRKFLRSADHAAVNLYQKCVSGQQRNRKTDQQQALKALRIMKFRSLGEDTI